MRMKNYDRAITAFPEIVSLWYYRVSQSNVNTPLQGVRNVLAVFFFRRLFRIYFQTFSTTVTHILFVFSLSIVQYKDFIDNLTHNNRKKQLTTMIRVELTSSFIGRFPASIRLITALRLLLISKLFFIIYYKSYIQTIENEKTNKMAYNNRRKSLKRNPEKPSEKLLPGPFWYPVNSDCTKFNEIFYTYTLAETLDFHHKS